MNQIVPAQVFICQGAEHKIDNRGSCFNVGMIDHSRWFKPCENKFFNKLFQRNSILETDRNGNSKTVQHATHCRAFLCHINKNFTERTITIFTCSQEQCLSVNFCFLSKASSLWRE